VTFDTIHKCTHSLRIYSPSTVHRNALSLWYIPYLQLKTKTPRILLNILCTYLSQCILKCLYPFDVVVVISKQKVDEFYPESSPLLLFSIDTVNVYDFPKFIFRDNVFLVLETMESTIITIMFNN
jgi:hypothetical protein